MRDSVTSVHGTVTDCRRLSPGYVVSAIIGRCGLSLILIDAIDDDRPSISESEHHKHRPPTSIIETSTIDHRSIDDRSSKHRPSMIEASTSKIDHQHRSSTINIEVRPCENRPSTSTIDHRIIDDRVIFKKINFVHFGVPYVTSHRTGLAEFV